MTNIGDFQVFLTSPPDREFLVTEVYFDGHQLAEVNYETGYFRVEIYPRGDDSTWDFPFQDFTAAIARAAEWLREEYDFSDGMRGKYADRFAEGSNVVVLDPDVAAAFKTPRDVNDALRAELKKRSASEVDR